MPAITLGQFEDDVLRMLNQPDNWGGGRLESGVNDTATLETSAAVWAYYNEAAEELCRTCYPLPMRASANLAASQRTVALGAATVETPAAASRLWAADAARVVLPVVTGTATATSTLTLQFTDAGALEGWLQYDGGLEFAASGVPSRWYRRQAEYVGVWPPPSATATLTLDGLALAPLATGTASETVGFHDEAVWALKCRVAEKLCEKNAEDPEVFLRAAIWRAEGGAARRRLWEGVDPDLRRRHYPTPPDAAMAAPVAVKG